MTNNMQEFGMNQSAFDGMEDYEDDVESTSHLRESEPEGDQVFDRLKSELSKPADLEPLTLTVPLRPNIAVVVDVRISYDDLQMWSKKATKRKKFMPRIMADIVLSNQVTAIRVDGKTALDVEGEPYTLASTRIHEMLSATGTRDAIFKLFGSDGHIIGALGKVMESAGYGDEEWEEEGGNPLSI